MSPVLLHSLEKVLIDWISNTEEPAMLTARVTILLIAQRIAEGEYDKFAEKD